MLPPRSRRCVVVCRSCCLRLVGRLACEPHRCNENGAAAADAAVPSPKNTPTPPSQTPNPKPPLNHPSHQKQSSIDDAVQSKVVGATGVVQLYRYPGLTASQAATLLRKARAKASDAIASVDGEICYNIQLDAPLSAKDADTLAWLLRETFEPELLRPASVLAPGAAHADTQIVVEVGPRPSFQTAWSTNAVSICSSVGLPQVSRLEVSRRYLLTTTRALSADEARRFAALVHDRMTEEVYAAPRSTFAVTATPAPTLRVPVLAEGRAALEAINKEMGLAFDDWDLEYYTKLFKDMGRDPTNVELFDIAQSNSEHSRHWFFRGDIVLDGERMPHNLMDIVKAPLDVSLLGALGLGRGMCRILCGDVCLVFVACVGGPDRRRRNTTNRPNKTLTAPHHTVQKNTKQNTQTTQRTNRPTRATASSRSRTTRRRSAAARCTPCCRCAPAGRRRSRRSGATGTSC